jgi:uncharacterized protein
MSDLPATAAWRHLGARDGFEVLFPRREKDGYRLVGHTSAIEEGQTQAVRYDIQLDAGWATRAARIAAHTAAGEFGLSLEADGAGAWRVDGWPAPEFDGYIDVDLEASAVTNALPVHRFALGVGERADAPAVYVRALDLSVERLEQTYERLPDGADGRWRYDYASPRFEYEAVLAYDRDGFVQDYPDLAARVA